jgi:2'-hydroxyisoflavone reductase
MVTRRHLLHAATGIAASALARALRADSPPPARESGKTLLILGGTGFIGPHLTHAAQQRGWSVTHFNRGQSAKDGVKGVETLIGDRKGDLAPLRNRRFDAVIDDSGYVPKYVRASAQLLAPSVGRYLFVSSISAYAGFASPNDELTGALGVLKDPDAEDIGGGNYGPMKVLCEHYVRETLRARSCIVRPGYIVGPGDNTDRFTYWPVRASQGGEMLAPGSKGDPVQYIDVRDLAAWAIGLIERGTTGVFNAVTPPHRYTMGGLVSASLGASPQAMTRVTWVPGDFLIRQLGEDGVNFPPWAPVAGDTAALGLVPSARAQAAGLRYRPLDVTVKDTLAWFQALPADRRSRQRLLLTAQREAELLAAWHRHQT